jgi:hypothetical protein
MKRVELVRQDSRERGSKGGGIVVTVGKRVQSRDPSQNPYAYDSSFV